MISTRLLGSGTVSALAIMLALAASPAAAATPATAPIMPSAMGTPSGSGALAETLAPVGELQDQRGRGGQRGGRAERSGQRSGGLGSGARAGNTGSWNGAQSRANRGGGRWNGGAQATNPSNSARAARSSNRGAATANAPARPTRYSRPEGAGARTDYRTRPNASSNGYASGSRDGYSGRAAGAASAATGAAATGNAAVPAYRSGSTAERTREGRGQRFGRTERGAENRSAGAGVNNPAAINQAQPDGVRADRRDRDWSNGRGVNARSSERGDARGNWRRDDTRRSDWRGDRRGNWQDNRGLDNRRDGWRDNRRGDWRDNRRLDNRRGDWRDNRRVGRQAAYNQGFRNGARWDRGWRNNNRFNWIGHRQANRFLFAPGRYYAPFAGHFYRPVGIGFRLDPLFFQPRFFLNDPWAFRLPPAGDRFRWVRYYEDVLLVDVFTGEVVDVIENFFW